MAPRILTFTLNPTIDLAAEAETVHPVRKVRTRGDSFDPGGGGVNVARVIRELGGEALAIILAGGVSGRLLEELLDEGGVSRLTVPISGRTRISHTVQDLSAELEYRFVPEGPRLSEAEWQAGLKALEETPGEWLVASGSLSPGVPEDFYARAKAVAVERGMPFVLDSSGPALRAALGPGLKLIKPSQGEFDALLGRKVVGPERAAAAQSLVAQGATELLAVTLGKDGALLASAEGVLQLPPLEVPTRGAVGAGDSFLAAMVLHLARGEPPREAFARGMAAGAAAVMRPGTAHLRREDVVALRARIGPLPAP
jgi:6-phosphofructokinase 2